MQQTHSRLNQNQITRPDLCKITTVWCDMLCAALMNDSSPFPCVWWSSDTGQWPQSRSSWCSREDWRGQNRRSLLDRYHTWHQQHFSTNMAEITKRKSEQGKTNKKCEFLKEQFDEMNSPCRDIVLCLGGTRQVWHHLCYSYKVHSLGSDNNLQHSDHIADLQSWACSYIKIQIHIILK